MRVLYVAKHESGGNDDEGAIAYALEQLGHEVLRIWESESEGLSKFVAENPGWDFCLFHKWSNFQEMMRLKSLGVPLVFWYWDLVDWQSDLTLSSRCEARKRWMAEVTPLVDLGFCTDGDWVARDTSGKLRVLRQGADERVVGFGKERPRDIDILFVGGVKGCGVERASFVDDLRVRYGEGFHHVERGIYGRDLANLVARSKVVVCPDSPVTWRYWSNRLYILGGFGACLLHPICYGIGATTESIDWFVAGPCSYLDRKQMFDRIDYLLECPEDRDRVAQMTLQDIKKRHLYRHRCEELIRVVKERLGI